MNGPLVRPDDREKRPSRAEVAGSDCPLNHRGKTPREVISDAVPGSLARAYKIADDVLAALDEAGFMVVSQEYVG